MKSLNNVPRKVEEIILASGHKNIIASHATTLEITKENHLTKKGTCIVAVSANKALPDLSDDFRTILRTPSSRLSVLVDAGEVTETLQAVGDPRLLLTHPTDIVIRRSDHICNRTLAVGANKAACDLSRKLVERLKNPESRVKVVLAISV